MAAKNKSNLTLRFLGNHGLNQRFLKFKLGGRMSEQLAYTLLAAVFGFIAAVFFCFGAALLRHKTIVVLAGTYWDFNVVQATAIVSQSAQYAVGALFLVVSFVLQVAAALTSPTALLLTNSYLSKPVAFVASALLALGLLAYFAYQALLHWRLPPVLSELEANTSAQ